MALQDGKVVGTASGSDSTYTGTASLTSLWVEPGFRGHGIGDLLVGAVLEWAKVAGFSQVLLWVTEGNSHAEELYLRHGFIRTGDVIDGEFEMSVRL